MPRKKAKKNAAKIRINKQVRDLDTGQFEFNDDKFEFTFSEDSSDDDYIAERFEKLNLVWFDSADNNVKKTYTGNSRATYFQMYWGAAKKYTRDNCNYTWSGLQITVPKALDSVPLITIRKFARKSWRYMDIYRKGITGKLAEFAVKKYKSHRRVPDTIYNEIK